jgi:hypothetical protein
MTYFNTMHKSTLHDTHRIKEARERMVFGSKTLSERDNFTKLGTWHFNFITQP